ncbi:peptidoglycan/LPS O-acetylase OafA/YrhL [Rhizobium sp. PP-F2F-G38]|nr:peptidoglycan/LPS O-acetylase OafA/YrhL [Rhizobium sp. PP-WC-1G-195]PYE99221.1 peptidoglycan/LPS O-acetylase OafA/YrhL [Rhizobium sp. PP-F2F-G38]
MLYRREIDGLRATAVTAVVLHHAGVPFLPGGFLGVDIFFVISGYLITAIIVRELESGTFSLTAFYDRRVRRILPALLVMLTATIPFAWIWMIPIDFKAYAQSLLSSLFSYSNIHFATKDGYFAPDMDRAPLLHTWSLAVEEQFYLLFPIFVVFLTRTRRNVLVPAIVGIFTLSFLLCLVGARSFPTINFYFLTSRAWELLGGALFSFVASSRSRRVNEVASLVGLALILVSFLLPTVQQAWPSALTLAPVLGAGLLLVFGVQGTFTARVMSLRPLVGLGLVSYSFYLWHQPFFAFARIRSAAEPPLAVMLGLALAALVVSVVTWRFIEQPFRKHSGPFRIGWKPFRMFIAAAGILIVTVSAAGQITKGLPWRMPSQVIAMLRESEWNTACLFDEKSDLPIFPLTECLHNPGHSEAYAIWGDSISSSLSGVLASELDSRGVTLQQFTHGFCAPLPGVSVPSVEPSAHCSAFNSSALEQILASPDIKTVVLAASWMKFFGYPGYEIDGTIDPLRDEDKRAVTQRLKDTIATIEASGRLVVLVYPHPQPDTSLMDMVVQQMLRGVIQPEVIIPYANFIRRSALSRSVLEAAASRKTLKVFPEDIFCNVSSGGGCALVSDGLPYLADIRHFTTTGAKRVVGAIIDQLSDRQKS